MRRIVISLSVVVVLLLGLLVATMGPSTTAQEVTPEAVMATASHPVVGAWRWDNNPGTPDAEISYGLFHADGTYTETTIIGVGIGVWRPTGARTAELTITFLDVDQSGDAPRQTATIVVRQISEVDETGNAITSEGRIEVTTLDGAVVYEGNLPSLGTRLHVEPFVPFGTPTAGTPTS